MKKVIVSLLSFFLILIAFSSCHKDYTCTCMVDKQQYLYIYKHEIKKEAQKTCDEQSAAAKLEDKSGGCSLSKN